MTRQFQRTIEDFVCGQCGALVVGNGYTNHCPHCLFSRHVDIHPGDRSESCGGLMAPIEISQKNGDFILGHRCLRCGAERRCKTQPEDAPALTRLAKKLSDPRTS